ncbi:MAG: ankyrin repeat domain-containing protein [Bdellovibrionales bacterium]|nr:ankyrin repeat domain-containing protein [Bdellovibrionales bacterium]
MALEFSSPRSPIRYNNLEFVKFLIENGADGNAKDKFGYTPLSFAIKYRNEKLKDFLMEKGAKRDNKNKCREIF